MIVKTASFIAQSLWFDSCFHLPVFYFPFLTGENAVFFSTDSTVDAKHRELFFTNFYILQT